MVRDAKSQFIFVGREKLSVGVSNEEASLLVL